MAAPTIEPVQVVIASHSRSPVEPTECEPATELAVSALVSAAGALPVRSQQELARRITDLALTATLDHAADLNPVAARQRSCLQALRSVGGSGQGPPTTGAYEAERGRRRLAGDESMPAVATIARAFGSWPRALIAAGLAPSAPASAFKRRLDYKRRQVHEYSDERFVECLRACARKYGRVPMVRDYIAWRDDARDDRTTDRSGIPAVGTIYRRFENWDSALAFAGLDGDRTTRCQTSTWEPLA